MKTINTSININSNKVKIIWYQDKWYYSALDIVKALINPSSPKTYFSKIKDRFKELKPYLIQLSLLSKDNKHHLTWFIEIKGANLLAYIIPIKQREGMKDLINNSFKSNDEQSKLKAYSLWQSELYKVVEIGTIQGLKQIHGYIFGGIYDFAGHIRDKNISKNSFLFSLCQHFKDILPNIDKMPQSNLEEIVEKYICMNIAHPFMEGNGRAGRLWLDLILKKELKLCVDWSKIAKKDYFDAMIKSYDDNKPLLNLLKSSLTNKIDDREIFFKGIDTSYYYEEN